MTYFHQAVRKWFSGSMGTPTEAQEKAWPLIREGKHTLIAAPTGSGKTLAAFLSVINDLVIESVEGSLPDETRVVYLSPLKALSNDIRRNLEIPLQGIRKELELEGISTLNISVAVRTGDTTQAERQGMLKHPPHILVTTPESLYILLTSEGGRKMLANVRTLILDEIHALLDDKRGSHLSLSVERLQQLVHHRIQRIGLSATQKPIQRVADFLKGNREESCYIVDSGHRRKLDLSLEVPQSPLTAIMSNEVWTEIHARIVELAKLHATTIIFVNTRRLAERLAHNLSEILGEDHVTSHHGSMSKEHRHKAEQKLKAGKLKVLVATASMELGIDVGSVELVIQMSSPHAIAAFLQRVGRSGHFVGGTPKGIIFPLTRDELVECTALIDAVKQGELDQIMIPEKPIDILAQQIVAEAATQEYAVDDMFALVKKAYPYRDLSREEYDEIIKMLADGFTTRRGRRGAYLYHDLINGKIRARKGARLVAITSGGAIPDTFDYEVVLEPDNTIIGTLNEDFALESLPGDVFLLGNHSWRILRIDGLKVRVCDAGNQPPGIPFWLAEGAGRSIELSQAICRLKEHISLLLEEDPLRTELIVDTSGNEHVINGVKIEESNKAIRWLVEQVGISLPAAEQLVLYLAAGKNALGAMPSLNTIIMERFFDEAGDMHLVIHSCYGSRVNRGWGLALRKKFCKTFNFELQAAANEDNIVISLGSTHSFPLEDVFRYLTTKTLGDTLVQAMLDAPMFEVRWRWNASRALAILRSRAGKKVPPQLQRMQAEDLVAQVFPDQIACFENIQGEREIPKHPLVQQTIHDCLTEAMDFKALEELIGKIERKELTLIAKDLREPSPFAQEVINARPYAFLDDTPFEERRVNAIRSRRWLDPAEASELASLDPEAIKQVKEEAWPSAETPDELNDALIVHGFITQKEGDANAWTALFQTLTSDGRATVLSIRTGDDSRICWVAAERIPQFNAIYGVLETVPVLQLPAIITNEQWEGEMALREVVRGRLEAIGPVSAGKIADDMLLPQSKIASALLGLEAEGFVFRGKYTPGADEEEWCERRLLHRINKYTLESLRQSIQPVTLQDYMRYLFNLHGLGEQGQSTGPAALQVALERLEGYEAPAAAWETDFIPSRVADYDPSWLDVMCMSGKIVWARFNQPKNSGLSPVKSTPICLAPRTNLNLWLGINYRNGAEVNVSSNTASVLQEMKRGGALFFDDIVRTTRLLKTQVENSISELVAAGLVTCDSYSGLRALLTPASNKPGINSRRNKQAVFGIEHAGRWTLMPKHDAEDGKETYSGWIEQLVFIYIRRYGVIFRKVLERENNAPPWRDLVRTLRRMEMRGILRGGRFISGASGEQFALPETVENLRKIRKEEKKGELISLSAVDPCNLLGIVLPGKKLSNINANRVLFKDGIAIAVLEGKEIHFLQDLPVDEKWEAQKAILKRNFPPKLRAYLGKNYG